MRYVQLLVEGYHDRAFVSGWLLRRGWIDPGQLSGGKRGRTKNPVTRKFVEGGRYGFQAPNAASFIEVVPVHGDAKLLTLADDIIRRAQPGEPHELVLVVDIDDTNRQGGRTRRSQAIDGIIAKESGSRIVGEDAWTVPSIERVCAILWSSDDDSEMVGTPSVHTLERLICIALARVYPERAKAVHDWLASRPDNDAVPVSKSYSWSHMAGWHADAGCEGFLSLLWKDEEVARDLERQLARNGAEAVLERIESK